MKIAYVFNLDRDRGEKDAEFDNCEQVERWQKTLSEFGQVKAVEFTDPLRVTKALSTDRPDLVVNMAEGHVGPSREAFVPMLCENLGIPFTGSGSAAFMVTLDKEWTKREVLRLCTMAVPRGTLISDSAVRSGLALADRLSFPLIVKPNCEGSSKGIYKDSVVEDRTALEKRVVATLTTYPGSVLVEEYIRGKDVCVPFLEIFRGSSAFGVPSPS